jgi:hypothetical protein
MAVVIKLTGDWDLAHKAVSRQAMRRAVSGAIKLELGFMRERVVDAFTTAGQSNGRPWEPTKHGTKAFDGSTIPDQVKVNHPPGALTGYVYIPRSAKFKRGGKGDTMRALMAHEYGAVISIPLTPRMLRAMHARARDSGTAGRTSEKATVGGVLVVRLPKRSFLVDTLAAHGGDESRGRMVRELSRSLPLGWRAR